MEHKARLFVLWALCCLTRGDLETPPPGGPVVAADPTSRAPPIVDVTRPLCAPEVGDRCLYRDHATNEYFYTINGRSQQFTFAEGDYFETPCDFNAIDDPALPRFARPVRFGRVILTGCGPPAHGSYAAALRRLNVWPTRRLALLKLPAAANLTRAVLADENDALSELELVAAPRTGLLTLAPGVVDALPLRALVLINVRAPSLPPQLLRLRLRDANLTTLPAPLDHLETLEVTESSLEEVEVLVGLGRLRVLALTTSLPARPPLPPNLHNLTLYGLQDPAPPPLRTCADLRELVLGYGALAALPAGLATACPQLQALSLQFLSKLAALPKGLLRGAARLQVLRVTFCPLLQELPDDLFIYSPELEVVNLSRNKLRSLPDGVFSPLVNSLRTLDLSYNLLRTVGEAVRPLTGLRVLLLAANTLGDLCPAAALARSALAPLEELRRLSLSDTGLTRLCVDWLRDMKLLRYADLTKNLIETVELAQLNKVQRLQPSELDLKGNPLRAVHADEGDVELAGSLHPAQYQLDLLQDLPGRFQCSCDAYWLWRAMRLGRLRVKMEPQCSDKKPAMSLRAREGEQLTCEVEGGCAYTPHEGGLLRCSALPPRLLQERGLRLRALALPGANLTELPAPLPAQLQYLDLDDNLVSDASAEAAAALLASRRRIRLTRNPLLCSCGTALLAALRTHRDQIEDLANTTCADGRPLAEALAVECGARAAAVGMWLGALGALALALAALALALLLASGELRLRAKAVLHARGLGRRWLRRRADAADASRPFDVFVSHAPADERWVLTQLAPRLRRAGLRLCLPAQHWPPGAWIPDQIEASVRGSRRTLCVLSPHWAAAQWAAAELRAAHAAALHERRPRLLLLLLPGAPPPPMRAPHLRWGEPCFWEKLLYALPDPPSAPAPGPAAPAAPAAPAD